MELLHHEWLGFGRSRRLCQAIPPFRSPLGLYHPHLRTASSHVPCEPYSNGFFFLDLHTPFMDLSSPSRILFLTRSAGVLSELLTKLLTRWLNVVLPTSSRPLSMGNRGHKLPKHPTIPLPSLSVQAGGIAATFGSMGYIHGTGWTRLGNNITRWVNL